LAVGGSGQTDIRRERQRRSVTGRLARLAIVVVAWALLSAVGASAAIADTITVSANDSSPVEGRAMNFTASGQTAAVAPEAVSYAFGAGSTCPAAPPSVTGASGGIELQDNPVVAGNFQVQQNQTLPVVLAAGAYTICGWLLDDSQSPPAVLATSFSALAVRQLTPTVRVSAPKLVVAGQPFSVRIDVGIDEGVPMDLDVAEVRSATCPLSASDTLGQEQVLETHSPSGTVSFTVQGNAAINGRYLICAWLLPNWSGAPNRIWTGPVHATVIAAPVKGFRGPTSQAALYPSENFIVQFGFQDNYARLVFVEVYVEAGCSRPVKFIVGPGFPWQTSVRDYIPHESAVRYTLKHGRLKLTAKTSDGGTITLHAHLHGHRLITGGFTDHIAAGPPVFNRRATCTSGTVTFTARPGKIFIS
jgi:hypothetical protein